MVTRVLPSHRLRRQRNPTPFSPPTFQNGMLKVQHSHRLPLHLIIILGRPRPCTTTSAPTTASGHMGTGYENHRRGSHSHPPPRVHYFLRTLNCSHKSFCTHLTGTKADTKGRNMASGGSHFLPFAEKMDSRPYTVVPA